MSEQAAANINPAAIIELVCRRTGVQPAVLDDTGNRHQDVVTARVIVAGLLIDGALLSLRRAGEVVGASQSVMAHRLRRWRARSRESRSRLIAEARAKG